MINNGVHLPVRTRAQESNDFLLLKKIKKITKKLYDEKLTRRDLLTPQPGSM